MKKHQLKYLKPSEIKPYFNNPRKNDKAIPGVIESISAYGFQAPILADENLVILAGHTRWKAAVQLELNEIPVVISHDLTDDQKKAYRIADNKYGETAEWDIQKLMQEVEGIDSLPTGFTEKELDKLFKEIAEENEEPLKPEVEFSQELHESSNYVVLYFDNDVDWLQAQTLFELQTVKALDSKKGFEKQGIGRVLKGTDAINRILGSDKSGFGNGKV